MLFKNHIEETPVKLSVAEFNALKHKSITLLGMSGVGKTRLSDILIKGDWFHYSGDYRIGTRYLDEAILDNIKLQAMQIPFLRDLLRTDSIYIQNNLSVNNLSPVSSLLVISRAVRLILVHRLQVCFSFLEHR